MCMYKTCVRSVLQAVAHGVVCVAAKGTQVGSMGAVIDIRTGTTDIEHEADLLSGFGEKPVRLPVNDNGTVENC